ncbi:hypothetical protein HK405_011865, partial [Cladochytrium tenue]
QSGWTFVALPQYERDADGSLTGDPTVTSTVVPTSSPYYNYVTGGSTWFTGWKKGVVIGASVVGGLAILMLGSYIYSKQSEKRNNALAGDSHATKLDTIGRPVTSGSAAVGAASSRRDDFDPNHLRAESSEKLVDRPSPSSGSATGSLAYSSPRPPPSAGSAAPPAQAYYGQQGYAPAPAAYGGYPQAYPGYPAGAYPAGYPAGAYPAGYPAGAYPAGAYPPSPYGPASASPYSPAAAPAAAPYSPSSTSRQY